MKPSMWRGRWGLSAAVPLVLAAGVAAQEPEVDQSEAGAPTRQQLQRQIEQLRVQIEQLRGGEQGDWLNQRRREEVRAVVEDVLDDAEGREGIGGAGATADYDDGFFMADPDGNFLLELGGYVQVRYIFNDRSDAPAVGDATEAGFQLRRAKFQGEGYVFTPDLRYEFSLAGDRDSETTVFEDYLIEYEFVEDLAVRGGRFNAPFALQELRSSSRQLAVERSSVHELFTADRTEGVMLYYTGDTFNLYGMINDGVGAMASDFDENTTDIAGTARAELLLAGEWDQFKDVSSWPETPFGVMLGAAAHYQVGETGTAGELVDPDDIEDSGDEFFIPNNDNFLLYTADLSIEGGGLGILLAGYGKHTDREAGESYNDFGLLAEAGYMVIPATFEPFLRYELILQDDSRPGVESGASNEATDIVTAGFNWYQYGHNAKFTLDAVYGFDPLTANLVGSDNAVSTGSGLRPDAPGEDGQLAIRAQYQLKF